MAIMNPSKLRDVLDLLPYCNLSTSKKRAIEAIITKYLNGEIVPVVRCRDCKHWIPGNAMCGNSLDDMQRGGGCPIMRFLRRENDFCCCGERKE